MPRKPKMGRTFCRKPDAGLEAMRKRFDSDWSRFWITRPENFFRGLPTPGEREAFARVFPAEFYGIFNFFSEVTDDCPASVDHDFRVFRRPSDEFLKMLLEAAPKPFEAVDVSALHFYPEQVETLAVARGTWWRANRLRMTEVELVWLEKLES